MRLDHWMQENNRSVAEMAALLTLCSERAVYRYIDGSRIPRPPIIARIRLVTAGKVTADDFFGGGENVKTARSNVAAQQKPRASLRKLGSTARKLSGSARA
jgi:hypothetical protein